MHFGFFFFVAATSPLDVSKVLTIFIFIQKPYLSLSYLFSLHLTVKSPAEGYSANMGFAHLAAGLSCGLSSLGAGLAIGIVGDYGVRAVGRQPKVYVGFILVLIFAEAIGLFGLIVALVLSTSVTS